MGNAVNPWLHIFAATLWVGPQVFLFAVAVPATPSRGKGPQPSTRAGASAR